MDFLKVLMLEVFGVIWDVVGQHYFDFDFSFLFLFLKECGSLLTLTLEYSEFLKN